MSYLPKFIEDVTSEDVMLGYAPVNQRLRNVLEYMGPTGKHLRQHLIIYTYKAIEEHYKTYSPEKMEEVHKLCWCLELFNTEYIVLDDFLDGQLKRRNKETWPIKEGKLAVMDIMLINISLPRILRKYFGQHPRFNEILDLFLRPEAAVSLALELETKSFDDVTMKRCEDAAMIKTAFHTCDQPFMLATLLANKGLHMNEFARRVLNYTALLYTAQNDFLDIYGEEITNKEGTDIQDKKCSYVLVMALEKSSDEQKNILKKYYGQDDQQSINKVKEVYDELDMQREYFKMEERYLQKASEEIRKIPDEFTRSLIEKLAYVQSFGLIGVSPY